MGIFTSLFNTSNTKERALPLFLYNTLGRKREEFLPIAPPKVGMYSCGPTVYDVAHIGNLRAYIFADTLRRTLEYNNFEVTHIINITDVGHLTGDADGGEDKMTAALKREKLPKTLVAMAQIGEQYTKIFKEDLEKLNIKTPKAFPKASEHIAEQIAFIKTLEEKGYTYELPDGVYFDTQKFPAYGALGGISKEVEDELTRLKEQIGKHSNRDFALWKKDKKLGWESPWGMGFPGWHIECSAMSMKYLGKHFDIHTGGSDHIAIHHNNEIAQSEAATSKPFVNYWMHNSFITIDGQKVSKSIGNTITLKQVTDKGFPPFALRYLFLTAHYRSQLNFTWDALSGAHTALVKLHKAFLELGNSNGTINADYQKRFHTFINDDIGTPQAIALVWELMDDKTIEADDKRVTLLDINRVLGIGLYESYEQMKKMLSGETKKVAVTEAPKEVQELLEKREEARREKDWEEADSLRHKIAEKGFEVSDTEKGPELHKQ
ncbi:cysteine--tRNA ligase [Candidatus Kaiserbacteria bacterium CG10_big_fil_rev_8_21_14_0_10_49_17]|uniref:Cysteine--tRNA ligase n=1 Tax=Candidatus Kaiserbacteria bacterium CG10_big_fil_rev_8_21_14_0_10_49_17 TaxID=1974609 RepID=A0A2M6WE00_9BACT|nr:MAG: cysteine--tRNA ligase [Candidatus Kaiserbacteria bacterium CG10_big_fil_rev_8_21_14_0_10_49_17]